MKTVAFIFARGGSKGLPGKNIKDLNGKPLIQYSIETAKKTKGIDKVFVSTDNDLIAEVASSLDVSIIKRPKKLATDNSPEWLSWQHAVNYVTKKYGFFDYFVSLPTTSPLRNEHDVCSALNKLKNTKIDICISITPSSRSPYFNMVRLLDDDTVEILTKPDKQVNRRQDTPAVFDITTVIYAAKTEFILEYNSIFSGKVGSVTVPKDRAIDIDDIYDFMYAEAILKNQVYDAKK